MVDRPHQSNRFTQCHDNALVVGDIFRAERPSFAVFQPFGTDWIAADIEVPDGFGDIGKAIAFFVEDDAAIRFIFGMCRINDTFSVVLQK